MVMDVITGSSSHTWQPVMAADTTAASYWLNWRVALCAVWIGFCMIMALFVIWKYEWSGDSSHDGEEDREGTLYADETWKPCLKEIHPAWLLVYRVTAFFLLLAVLVANAVVDSGGIFYFYTQWTFTLVTVYFALGSFFSCYGCFQFSNRVGGDRLGSDAEQGHNVARATEGNANGCNLDKISVPREQSTVHQLAGTWSYIFQVIFQVNAGAVLLTDFVFWFIIFPFLAIRDYRLNFFLVGMHSINAVVLLGETTLNCLRFPWFRIAYFVLWTCAFVIFQWVIHACVSLWWPYPFLDLSSRYAPIWYLVVGLMHIPCYAIFASIVKLKHYLWLRWFPHSYQCRR